MSQYIQKSRSKMNKNGCKTVIIHRSNFNFTSYSYYIYSLNLKITGAYRLWVENQKKRVDVESLYAQSSPNRNPQISNSLNAVSTQKKQSLSQTFRPELGQHKVRKNFVQRDWCQGCIYRVRSTNVDRNEAKYSRVNLASEMGQGTRSTPRSTLWSTWSWVGRLHSRPQGRPGPGREISHPVHSEV